MVTNEWFASDADVAAIGEGLTDRTLPKERWTHAAHFAAAVWLLRAQSGIEAHRRLPALIRAYNESTGVANTDSSGYHETITLAALRAASEFLREHPSLSLSAACNTLLATPLGKSDWLYEYWSRSRLFNVAARRAWVEPDLKPLPF